MSDPFADDDTPWRDSDTLRYLYDEKGLNKTEVAERLGCTTPTIIKWLDEHDIKERKSINKSTPWRNGEKMRELYREQQLSCSEIAQKFGCAQLTILEWLKKHGIETRDRLDAVNIVRRKNPPCLNMTGDGYEYVACHCGGESDTVRIHRLVAVAEHGFDAVCDRIVHHKNGVPWDNRPKNLEIMTMEEHAKVHRPIEVRWNKRNPAQSLKADGGKSDGREDT